MIRDKNIDPLAKIAFSKFAGLASTKMLVGNASGDAAEVSITGDVTVTNAGVTAIGAAKVTNAMRADMAANTVKVRDANSSGVGSDVAVADTEVLIGDGTGFTAAPLSGDITMTNAGATTVGANKILTTMMEVGMHQYKKITLTDTQVKALATPIEIIAAPGAGKLIVVHQMFLHLDYGTATYAEPSAPDDLRFEYGDGLDITGDIDATGFITATADTWSNVLPTAVVKNAAATVGLNKNVRLINTGGDYTTGDGTLDIYISYSIADFS